MGSINTTGHTAELQNQDIVSSHSTGRDVPFDCSLVAHLILSTLERKCDLFNCTQSAQRGFLRLSESFHFCDVEPFVGPVAPQRAQELTALEVPHLDGSIIAATGQLTAIGADLDRLDRPLMHFSHPHTVP